MGSHSYPSAEVDATLETKMLSKVLKNNSLSLFNEKKKINRVVQIPECIISSVGLDSTLA